MSENVSSGSGNNHPPFREWEVICWFLNSGILHWNLLMFPFKLEREGEGIYIYVHLLVTMVVIRPIILIELSVGQLNQTGALQIWGEMIPLFRGVGFASTLVSIFALGSASFLTSLGTFYLSKSFICPLSWANGSLHHKDSQIEMQRGSSADTYYRSVAFPYVTKLDDDISLPHWHLCVCMAVIWLGICILHLTNTSNSIFPRVTLIVISTAPYLILCFLLFGCMWNGATLISGVKSPSSFRMLAAPKLWISSVAQCFLYLPNGIGTATRLAAMCNPHCDISKIATCLSLAGFLTERLVGIFFYTLLQQHSDRKGIALQKLLKTGSALLLVTLPDYFSSLELFPQILTVMYFILIVNACTTRTLVLFRGLKGALLEMYPNISEASAVVVLCIAGYLIGLPFLTPHGKMIRYLVSSFGVNFMKVIFVFLQVSGICVSYKWKRFTVDVEFMIQKRVSVFTKLSWKILIAPVLTSVTVKVVTTTEFLSYNRMPVPRSALGAVCVVFAAVFLSFLLPGVFELYKISKYSRESPENLSILKIFKKALRRKASWGPKNQLQRQEWTAYKNMVRSNNSLRFKLRLLGVTSE